MSHHESLPKTIELLTPSFPDRHTSPQPIGAHKGEDKPSHLRGGKNGKDMTVTKDFLHSYTVKDKKKLRRKITAYNDGKDYDGVLYTVESGQQWFVTSEETFLPRQNAIYLNEAREVLEEREGKTLVAPPSPEEVVAYYREHAQISRELIEYVHNENGFFFKASWPHIVNQLEQRELHDFYDNDLFCAQEVNITDYQLIFDQPAKEQSCGIVDLYGETHSDHLVIDFGTTTKSKRANVLKYIHGSQALIKDHTPKRVSPPITGLIGEWSVDENQVRVVKLIKVTPPASSSEERTTTLAAD